MIYTGIFLGNVQVKFGRNISALCLDDIGKLLIIAFWPRDALCEPEGRTRKKREFVNPLYLSYTLPIMRERTEYA